MIKALLSHDAHMIACGESHIAMITLEQKAFTWGAGAHGRLGTGSQENWYGENITTTYKMLYYHVLRHLTSSSSISCTIM